MVMSKIITTGLIYLVAIQVTLAGPLDTAFERMNNFNKKAWSFQIITNAEEHKVELYNPNNEPEWTLLTLNNESPSEQQLKSYHRDKAKQIEEITKDKKRNNDKMNLHEMIDTRSLTLIEEGAETDKYSFQPIIEKGDFSESLNGELWHNKQHDFIEQFGFHNINAFSPMLGVKIKKMRTHFKFKKIASGTFAPDHITAEISGKAFGFKKIDSNESQTYQAYKAITTE